MKRNIKMFGQFLDKILSMRGFDGGFKNSGNLENDIILNRDKLK